MRYFRARLAGSARCLKGNQICCSRCGQRGETSETHAAQPRKARGDSRVAFAFVRGAFKARVEMLGLA
jgi:hypothetical protein